MTASNSTRPPLPGLLAIFVLALSTIAQADGTPAPPMATQAGIVDPSIGVPETSGESQSEQLATTSIDPSTGIAQTSVQFKSPNARGLAQPGISLEYSSEAGMGYAGWGWTLSIPSIERRPLSGAPNFDPAPAGGNPTWVPKDQLFFGGKRLVPICRVIGGTCARLPEAFPTAFGSQPTEGWWYFRQAEDSSFDRFFLSPDQQTWIVQSKSGVTMELGRPLASSNMPGIAAATETTSTHAAQANVPYRWSIVRKYDSHVGAGGPLNIVYYIWSGGAGTRLFLTDVYDTPSVVIAIPPTFATFAHHLAFHYETPPNIPWGGVQSPIWRALPTQRLSGVDVTSARFNDHPGQREMVRRYHLTYNQTRLRSYLAAVTLEGECTAPMPSPTGPIFESTTTMQLPVATNCPTRPGTSFNYQTDGAPSFGWLTQPMTGNVPASSYLVDINSDGLPDFAAPATSSGARGTVTINAFAPPATVALGAAEFIFMAEPATGVTGQNFFPDPKATGFKFTTGNFVANGNVNIAWFGAAPSATSGTYPLTVYSPAPFGPPPDESGWGWQKEATYNIALNSSPPNDTWPQCIPNTPPFTPPPPPETVLFGTSESPETPYGTADVDGDGFPDLLTYTVYETCGVACFPDGCLTPSGSAQIRVGLSTTVKNQDGSLSPFGLNKGYLGAFPLSGDSGSTRLLPEDLNGDGLTDLIAVSTQEIAVAYGLGDGTLSYAGGPTAGSSALIVLDIPGYTASVSDPSQVYIHDVNGDGLADVLVVPPTGSIKFFANQDGWQFAAPLDLPQVMPGLTGANTSLSFGDMNGSGVDDVVVVQKGATGNNAFYVDLCDGLRPGLLSTITNGVGGTTLLSYASTLQLDVAARVAGTPWTRHVPQVLHHVVDVVTTNTLPGLYAQTVYAQSRETKYTYANPVLDARDQRFVGFQNVVRSDIGAGDDPSVNVATTYLTGLCELDDPAACPVPSADRPFLPLTGVPVLVETYDDSRNYLSTIHTTYQVKEVETGTDGSYARFALPVSVDTYLYDTAAPSTTNSTVSFPDVKFSDANAPVPQFSRNVILRGGATHVQRSTTYDTFGNVLTTADAGIVGGTDQAINVTSTWTLAPGDITGWLWRKHTEVTAPFQSIGVFADQGSSKTFTYDAQGDLRIVQMALTGNVALNRHDAQGRVPAPTPGDASHGAGALVQVSHHEYDLFGNSTQSIGPNGVSCEQTIYDPQFAQLAITDIVYTASPSTCTGAGITSSIAYDRGLELPTLKTSPGGAFSLAAYDEFGRTWTITKSDPANVTQLSTQAAVQMTYLDTPIEAVNTMTWDGTAYRSTWAYVDGVGNSLLNLKQAASSDPGTWIVSGVQQRGARGEPTDTYLPYFTSSINPSSLVLTAMQPTSASRHTKYDAFGRAILTKGFDGVQDSETHYHAVSSDVYDALHLPSSKNPFATTTQKDGHGRVVMSQVSGRLGSSAGVTSIKTIYGHTATGSLTTVTRSSGNVSVTQSIAYDSLGRMVENREPNTTTSTSDWRYVYNDSGELVATSDPRGCGVNVAYDAAGREVSEDYSPCAANHSAHTAPLPTGSGLEMLYVYDAPVGTTPTSPDGRLYASMSRGEFTRFSYDARGRMSSVMRALAIPGVPADDWHNRYASSSYTFNIAYDDADRVTSQGTGGSALAINGISAVTTKYDERGNIGSMTSSYGDLVTATEFDADGQLLKYEYADRSETVLQRDYDRLRRLSHSNVTRSSNWAPKGGGYAPPSDGSTLENVLEAKTFTYDLVGNPIGIVDASSPGPWPVGAKPVSRSIGYDDFYHVTTVTDSTGNDHFNQPLAGEFASASESPMPSTLWPTRIVSQTFNYDWLGNTTASDDDAHLFYDRSLGTITNDPVRPNLMTQAVGTTDGDALSVAYDDAGNVAQMIVSRSKACTSDCVAQRLSYEWDELGRMSRATRASKSGIFIRTAADISYAYDGSGARVMKAVTMGGETLYTAEIFPTLRLEGAVWNTSTATYEDDTATEAVYLAGPGGPVARVEYSTSDPAISTSENWHVLFELSDALHSTSFVVDKDTSELVEAATYQPYGAVESDFRTSRWGNFREPYKFTGKEDDIEVGVTYFGGRYYAPNLGRWMSPDPVAVHTVQGNLNPYAYASGRVFRVTDPTGLSDSDSGVTWNASDTNSWMSTSAAMQGLASSVPGFDTAAALQMQWQASDPANSFLDGFQNSLSDPVNTFGQWLGAQGNVVPTFAPGADTSNLFNAGAYGAGGATGGGLALEGVAAVTGAANLGGALASVARGASALGDGMAGLAADTRGGASLGNLLTGGESMEGAAQGAGFKSFDAFKAAAGPAGDGMQWHHLVEQNPTNVARFAPEALHNTGNLVRIPEGLHGQINAFYSSPNLAVTGSETMTVRQWVSGLGFTHQQEFGQAIYGAVLTK